MGPFPGWQVCEGLSAAARTLVARAVALFNKLIEPHTAGEDGRSREYILNIMLVLSLGLFIVWTADAFFNRYIFLGVPDPDISPYVLMAIICVYALLFALSRVGKARAASYLLVASYVIGALYAGWTWGASLPATLLICAMTIVASGVLLGSTFGLWMTVVMMIALSIFGVHEYTVLNVPNWRYEEIDVTDVITYAAAFLFMGFISWLSNREIKGSLERAQRSERALAEERDTLEQRVAARTEEFIAVERTRTEELERIAQFGKLSQGLFHDLITPLSSVALHIEALEGGTATSHETACLVNKTVEASNRMRSFMDSVKRCLQNPDQSAGNAGSDVAQEVSIALDLLGYKARLAQVEMLVERCDGITLPVPPMRIHQLFVNLISNAIESYPPPSIDPTTSAADSVAKVPRVVTISVTEKEGSATIRIADNGSGMDAQRLGRIFDRSFSTKNAGSGIGLATVESIVKDGLSGVIEVTSEPGTGTTFTITIPYPKRAQNN